MRPLLPRTRNVVGSVIVAFVLIGCKSETPPPPLSSPMPAPAPAPTPVPLTLPLPATGEVPAPLDQPGQPTSLTSGTLETRSTQAVERVQAEPAATVPVAPPSPSPVAPAAAPPAPTVAPQGRPDAGAPIYRGSGAVMSGGAGAFNTTPGPYAASTMTPNPEAGAGAFTTEWQIPPATFIVP